MILIDNFYAKTLGFNHPKNNRWLEFSSKLPDRFGKNFKKTKKNQ